MNRYFLTFGQDHPNKDGYEVVHAEYYTQARALVVEKHGRQWAFLHDSKEFEEFVEEYFPEGKLGEIP